MESIIQQIVPALGWSILHSLWQAALAYLVVILLYRILGQKNSILKHHIAYAAMLGIFISFIYSLSTKLMFSALNGAEAKLIYTFGNLHLNIQQKTEMYFPMLVSIYALGLFLQCIILLRGYHKLRKYRSRGLSALPYTLENSFHQLKLNLSISPKVKAYCSTLIHTPLMFGYLKPIILIPLALLNHLDEQQVEAILLHELAHIKRRDYLLNIVKNIIETVLFFNPFIWLMSRLVEIERENACDDIVVKTLGSPLPYAGALLKLEIFKSQQHPAYTLAADGHRNNLYYRIKRITDMKVNYFNVKQQVAAIVFGIACVLSVAWVKPSVDKKEKEIKALNQRVLNISEIQEINTTKAMSDTVPPKMEIIVKGADGKRKVYTSVDQLPDSFKKRLKINRLNEIYLNKDFKAKILNLKDSAFSIYLNDKKLQKNIDSLFINGKALAIVNDKAFKKQLDLLQKQSKEFKDALNSPEYKSLKDSLAKVSVLALKSLNQNSAMLDLDPKLMISVDSLSKLGERIALSFRDADFNAQVPLFSGRALSLDIKEQLKDLKKLQEHKEYKELLEKRKKEREEMRKKLDIKTTL